VCGWGFNRIGGDGRGRGIRGVGAFVCARFAGAVCAARRGGGLVEVIGEVVEQ
jgi:hypothetical protein